MDVASLCSALVQIKSENPPGDTSAIIEYLHSYLENLGVRSEMVKGEKGRWNLISLPLPGGLLFCGHVDVVPAEKTGWSRDPYSGEIAEGYVWGRGSSDMKGGCAAILTAFRAMIEKGEEPPVNLAFVCDEETGGRSGIRTLLAKHRISPCDCIIAEPTPPMNPSIGQKGLCRIDFSFEGVPAHASLYPCAGRSAIMDAILLIDHLTELHKREYRVGGELGMLIDRSAEVLEKVFGISGIRQVLTHVTFNPGVIRGGEKVNIVAQHCRLELDLRIPWGYSVQSLAEEIRAYALHATMKVVDCADPNMTSPKAEIVGAVCTEIERVYQAHPQPIVQWAASDAKFLRLAGCNVVEYGPGDLTTLHGIDERTPVHSLENTVKVYAGLMHRYSQRTDERD
jgi:succinyl-diaminopimelate desuccinylase